jgi:DNA-binding transcriptional LysR family regulator
LVAVDNDRSAKCKADTGSAFFTDKNQSLRMNNPDLRHLELRQLRYFIAVAEEMHFGKAALRLNMTQPPLSQAIQSLESFLGTALFIRTTRHTALTPAGIALLPEARRLLEQANSLRQLAQQAPQVRAVICHSLSSLSPITAYCRRRCGRSVRVIPTSA